MKILVTGANSLLGIHLLDALSRDGHEVRAMVRRASSLSLRSGSLEIFEGGVTDSGAADLATAGCEAVIHLAANTSQHAQPYVSYAGVNVEGTRYIATAAARQGVRRFIHVSSANTCGYGTEANPGTEENAIRCPFTRSGYARSKQAAEAVVLATAARGMEVIVVNPCFIIGSHDSRPSSGKVLLRAAGRRVVWAPPGGKNFIGARDAAAAIARALSQGTPGERYLLGGENLSYRAFYRLMRQVTGDRFRILVIPAPVLLGIGVVGSLLVRAGIPNVFHLNNMRILCIKNYYTSHKAAVELDMSAAPLAVAIAEAMAWFGARGMLRRRSDRRRRLTNALKNKFTQNK